MTLISDYSGLKSWTVSAPDDVSYLTLIYSQFDIIRQKALGKYEITGRHLCRNIDPFINVSMAFYFGMTAAAAEKGDESSINMLKTMWVLIAMSPVIHQQNLGLRSAMVGYGRLHSPI